MAGTSNNPDHTQQKPKNSKKKKSKAEGTAKPASVESSTPTTEVPPPALQDGHVNGDGAKEYESPYIKELHKSIRNVNKKLAASAKVDGIVAQHDGQTLDELVAARVINSDQKAQVLKKPALQASLAQLEDQIAQYKKFDREYQARLNAEKSTLVAAHAEEKVAWEKAVEAAKNEATKAAEVKYQDHLLTVSKFLRAAAAKRMEEANSDADEHRAFEGLLLILYAGDQTAVQAVEKLINGSDERVLSTDGEELVNFTYAQVKESTLSHAMPAESEGLGGPSDSFVVV